VRSASRLAHRTGLWAALVLLLAFGAVGCQTTQDKAAEKQAESKRILEKREQKRSAKAHGKRDEKP
jgi:uncharacterized membrane protein